MKNLRNIPQQFVILTLVCAPTIFLACHDERESHFSVSRFPLNNRMAIAFSESAGTITENNINGIVVRIDLSQPATSDGELLVYGPYIGNNQIDIIYGNVYKTIPEIFVDDFSIYIPLFIKEGSTNIEFTILPVNNDIDNDDITLEFTMAGEQKYTLTILDED